MKPTVQEVKTNCLPKLEQRKSWRELWIIRLKPQAHTCTHTHTPQSEEGSQIMISFSTEPIKTLATCSSLWSNIILCLQGKPQRILHLSLLQDNGESLGSAFWFPPFIFTDVDDICHISLDSFIATWQSKATHGSGEMTQNWEGRERWIPGGLLDSYTGQPGGLLAQ